MSANHTSPCSSCPFLTKNAGMITGGRASEIADGLNCTPSRSQGVHFWCHKTVDYRRGTGDGVATSKTLLCAGSLIVAQRSEAYPTQVARISMRIGLLDWSAIEKHAADPQVPCFASLDAFIAAHAEKSSRV